MAICVAFASVNAQTKKPRKSKKTKELIVENILVNDVDSMSYALGMNMGADFAKNMTSIPGGKSNVDMLIAGFVSAMKGEPTIMTQGMATTYFQDYITQAQTKDAQSKKAADEEFLAHNMTKPDVSVTPSGLQYTVTRMAEGAKPTAKDTVVVHYEGTLLDGTKFDSSYDRGEPIEFPLNQVIKGWTEGVQLMSVGSKYRLFVPYNLGYGEQGAGGMIPPFATLIFDVELLDIKPFKGVNSFRDDIQPLQ